MLKVTTYDDRYVVNMFTWVLRRLLDRITEDMREDVDAELMIRVDWRGPR